MRLFTGISVEEDAIPGLAGMRSLADLRWTPAASLHVTTKFIGAWPEERLGELVSALGETVWARRVTIEILGLDLLPHVLIADVVPEPALVELYRATEDTLERLGCARETRPYRPHITLARFETRGAGALRETIANMRSAPASFEATSFHLYQSKSGSIYTKLATYS